MLKITLYSVEPATDDDNAALAEIYSDTVDYVSLYNGETHGPPALVAPGRVQGVEVQPKARPGDEVFYINTALVPAFKIERFEES